MELKKVLNKKVIVFDGAMGTMLQREGLAGGELPDIYNIEKPDIVKNIHKAYIDAGADIITTNTFGSNSFKLKDTPYTVSEVISAAVNNIKAIRATQLIALGLSSTGKLLEPIGNLTFDEAYNVFKEQVVAGTTAGADVILLETFSDLQETRAAILACKENSDLPVFCTMTFQDNGRTLTGTDPKTFVNVAQDLGIDVLGVNCSLGPKEIAPIVEEILETSLLPVMIQPNAGLPVLENGETIFKLTKEEYVEQLKPLMEKGVAIVGSCCGSDPTFTKLIYNTYGKMPVVPRNIKRKTVACSSTKSVYIDGRIKIIGERINPTGKKKIKEALNDHKLEFIINEAINQSNSGSDILDINIGLPGIDEKSIMLELLKELDGVVNTPLQIDSSKTEVLEAACRYYNGKAIINSVNGKQNIMDAVFPIAKKYGASLVALTLDEDGIPDSCEKRLSIADKIINEAKKYGIDEERIIIDNLVLTASAQQQGVLETLKAIKKVKEKYNVKTTLGTSNVSFGLPNRHMLNKSFLLMALSYGLDAPITDSTAEDIVALIKSFEVLNNLDIESNDYINYMDSIKSVDNQEKPIINNVKDMNTIIKNGLKDEIESVTNELLKLNEPLYLVDKYIIPSLDEVGNLYNVGKIYLPQLIRSAETVKIAFDIIKSKIKEEGNFDFKSDKILIATVRGDIHDIGKNIVKVILENYGYDVIDLGKDVPTEKIISKIKEEKIKLVGLSALMTTTVINMQETISKIREEKLDCKILVGGAVLTPEYALEINADYYCKDARETAEIANMIFK